jgi:hypothetical protein
MEIAIPILASILVATLVSVGIALRRSRARRDREAGRNDLLRAGTDPELTPEAAASRAEGKTAWMRPSGL